MTNTQTPSTLVADTGPRIYVACLAAYNSGKLHGVWIEVDRGEEHIRDSVRAMLVDSPEPVSEEWAIHDYEGFEDISLSEHAGFACICALSEFIADHGALGAKLYDYCGNNVDEARAAFDHYAGKHSSTADFVERLHNDIGTEIPESLSHYIDWERLARDMTLSGEIITFQTEFDATHVFWTW